jgi:formylglycine-generating enzyme required for sulfatase activity
MGGTYFRTYDPLDDAGNPELSPDGGPTGEADPATVSSFRLDKYEVTIGRFRQFVNAVLPPDGGVGWRPAPGSGKHAHLNGGQGLTNSGGGPGAYETGWAASDNGIIEAASAEPDCYYKWQRIYGLSTNPTRKEKLPIHCMGWEEAYAFCIWDGGFLPSEAEWEYAAAGGSEQRKYPWGSTSPGRTIQYAIYHVGGEPFGCGGACTYPNAGCCTGVANIAPVGTATLGAGRWGQLDLAGNINEWSLDWYTTYVNTTPCTDCAYLTMVYMTVPWWEPSRAERVARGGGFDGEATSLLPPERHPMNGDGYYSGFRCARTP